MAAFLPTGPRVFGLDETLERRWGPRIAARGIYRDAVRSSAAHLVKCSGCAGSVSVCSRSCPCSPCLPPRPSEPRPKAVATKKVTDWARQAVKQLARWLPGQTFICLGDSGYAVLSLLAAMRAQTCWLIRLRLDTALFGPAPIREPGQRGRSCVKGARLPGLAQVAAAATTCWQALSLPADARGQTRQVEVTTGTALWYSVGIVVPIRWVLVRAAGTPVVPLSAFLSTDLSLAAVFIVTTYAQRWALEVTFAQVRAHLGVETQRQWTDLVIARTTPVLLDLFSLVTLLAARLHARGLLRAQACAWYEKAAPIFSDALAAVRRYLWAETRFDNSPGDTILFKIPRHQLHIWQEALVGTIHLGLRNSRQPPLVAGE